jgi:hypothetical protein
MIMLPRNSELDRWMAEWMGWTLPDEPDAFAPSAEVWYWPRREHILRGIPFRVDEPEQGEGELWDHRFSKWSPATEWGDLAEVIDELPRRQLHMQLHQVAAEAGGVAYTAMLVRVREDTPGLVDLVQTATSAHGPRALCLALHALGTGGESILIDDWVEVPTSNGAETASAG